MSGGERAWVKFFGNARNRVSPATPVLDVLERTGAQRSGSYPVGRRPRSVRDGDRMFQARLVTEAGIGDILEEAFARVGRLSAAQLARLSRRA